MNILVSWDIMPYWLVHTYMGS